MFEQLLTLLMLVSLGQSETSGSEPLRLWADNIGAYVRKNVGCADRRIGYTADEMAPFAGYPYRLAFVSRFFEDAERVPVETDRFARRMLSEGYDGAIESALGILGAKRSDVSAQAQPGEAIEPVDDASKTVWASLPDNVRLAVEDLVRGAMAARTELHQAFDWDAFARQTGGAGTSDLGAPAVYNYAVGPWGGSGSSASLAALQSFRSSSLGNAGRLFLAAVRTAVARLEAVGEGVEIPRFVSCRLKTPAGFVRILGTGNSSYQVGDAIVIDLGGNDHYSGRVAVPRSKASPVGLLIDVSGDDTYDCRQAPASIACGLFGIGVLVDLGGHDKYFCRDSGLGCAWHGIGLLVDKAGNDQYSGNQWCQGAAHAGAGFLIDESGDDRYLCQLESQGLGSTLGVGVLIDKAGDDRYHAYDDENGRAITFPSSQTKSHEVSLVQGCGYGRRADSLDGKSLAGGVGALIDGAGNDSYYGGVFSQATGFWWGLGMLVDFGGDDQYRGVYYAQGAAAHFAVGSHIDHAGHDRYNDQRVLGQVLGAGRDAAIGAFLDLVGDDVYYIPKKSAGGGDANAIGLFCDRRGSDKYHALSTSCLGTASASNSRGESFRTQMPTIGLFVDLDGDDEYPPGGRPTNQERWHHQNQAALWGFGLDTRPQSSESAPQPDAPTTTR